MVTKAPSDFRLIKQEPKTEPTKEDRLRAALGIIRKASSLHKDICNAQFEQCGDLHESVELVAQEATRSIKKEVQNDSSLLDLLIQRAAH